MSRIIGAKRGDKAKLLALTRTSSVGHLPSGGEPALKVTVLEVYGMCCQSEVSLVQKKLGILPGVQSVRVNLMLRQVAVTHEPNEGLPERLVRTLNWALLDAHILTDGGGGGTLLRRGRPTGLGLLLAGCTLLFAVSFGTWGRVARGGEAGPWYEDPFSYFALACAALGAPLLLARAAASLVYEGRLNMLVAVAGALGLRQLWEGAAIVFFFVLSEAVQKWCVHHTARQAGALGGLLPAEAAAVSVPGGPDKPIDAVAAVVREETRLACARLLTRAACEVGGRREQLLEAFAKWYLVLLVSAAALVAIVPMAWCEWSGGDGGGDLVGTANHTHVGVLVKSSRQLELLAAVRTLAMDKTGTLTEGRFRFHRMVEWSEAVVGEAAGSTERVVKLAASVESLSSHPVAAAFLDFAQSLGAEPEAVEGFATIEGEGVSGSVGGVQVHVGSEVLARRVLATSAATARRAAPAASGIEAGGGAAGGAAPTRTGTMADTTAPAGASTRMATTAPAAASTRMATTAPAAASTRMATTAPAAASTRMATTAPAAASTRMATMTLASVATRATAVAGTITATAAAAAAAGTITATAASASR
ncbi:hypothetical protein EMIHUDRAFT_111900 [Emiliania huxleyi CCMP1516]|uniref:HMA domain-containing protein n=2 Tax=Emiliania huxleyi TaxID=2903 RepID=A0A0D3KC42_EMIH1|nr:hypothetical protein EMIHUDRAFT_111900 [Emiliania huxleyi CCMP1516]EOD33327.1 hypothetical protein EMIHUDRAFT_111900 [Emiliania huxleyi CCMP1516]|eukprot:XP_005785756.1 hypothetical protein EMIHUDRAFT_111900 [Emiliania huxleyi CCMP1516]